ncbi:MAG: hypothetical protein GEU97_05765 [Actinophytocola sp.]|nr:hypothetical protein [Actinophytocola sp.]
MRTPAGWPATRILATIHDIATLERRLADAWPAFVDEPLGAWRLRATGGFTGRANSALTCDDPGVPLGEALTKVDEFARTHGIRPTAHVVRGDPIEDDLTEHGWRVDVDHPGGAEPLVLVAPLDGASPPDAVTIATHPSTSWWRLCADTDPPDAAQRRALDTGDRVRFGGYIANGALALYDALGFTEHHRYRYWVPGMP